MDSQYAQVRFQSLELSEIFFSHLKFMTTIKHILINWVIEKIDIKKVLKNWTLNNICYKKHLIK